MCVDNCRDDQVGSVRTYVLYSIRHRRRGILPFTIVSNVAISFHIKGRDIIGAVCVCMSLNPATIYLGTGFL